MVFDDGIDRAMLVLIRHLSWKIQFQQRVSRLPPVISDAVYRFVTFSNQQILSLFRWFWPNKYTSADPYKIYWVDPARIKYYSSPTGLRRRGWVVDGDWDVERLEFMGREIPRLVKIHHENHGNLDIYGSENKLCSNDNKNIQRIEDLYQKIRYAGYVDQATALKKSPNKTREKTNDVMHPLLNEIGVDIGRDGELLWHMGGQHRLAIAKVLKVEKVPVQIYRRHTHWERIRRLANEQGTDAIPIKYHNHPDISR